MNKYTVILFLGIITVVLAESALKRDKETLIKALKEKFRQYKKKKLVAETKSAGNGDVHPSSVVHNQKQHEKAASAIGLALLDVSKPKTKEEKKTDKTEADNDDDDMSDDNDVDDINVEMSTKKEDQVLRLKGADKNEKVADNLKKDKTKKEKQEDIDVHEGNKDGKVVTKEDKKEDKADDKDDETEDGEKEDDEKDDDKKQSKDSDKEDGKDSKNNLKNTAKALKESAKRLKDKAPQAVNVGQLKKLLATSVENLDKAGKAIQNLMQYDKEKKAHSRNKPVPPQRPQGYPQQGYGGYPQPSSPYQQTCPGQCSSVCAPACRDPCCRFPPGFGQNSAPAVQARGSYQQGLINAYPPLTQLGGSQGNQNYQPQSYGQQCGPQCSAQSCASSCSPSCCSSGNQMVPQGQAHAGCPFSCLSNCAAACHARCCVPGKK